MNGKVKAFIWVASGLLAAWAAVRIHTWSSNKPLNLSGAVLSDEIDPAKQTPISNATVTAFEGEYSETTKSDASGLFKLSFRRRLLARGPVTLKFQHSEYQPLQMTAGDKDWLYVARMKPVNQVTAVNHTEAGRKIIQIKNVRVRYSVKKQTTVDVGSVAKQFEVVNSGDVPCRGRHPCSPDGKWKAAIGGLSLDAQQGSEFRNLRVSCVAGPCPFTKIQSGLPSSDLFVPARKVEITALDWSDTASFLVEAEVTHTMTTNALMLSYPFETGQTMTFALPASAEGPTVIADLNGEEIVCPLGPDLILDWATCSVEVSPGRNKIYRCALKPGYNFEQ